MRKDNVSEENEGEMRIYGRMKEGLGVVKDERGGWRGDGWNDR